MFSLGRSHIWGEALLPILRHHKWRLSGSITRCRLFMVVGVFQQVLGGLPYIWPSVCPP